VERPGVTDPGYRSAPRALLDLVQPHVAELGVVRVVLQREVAALRAVLDRFDLALIEIVQQLAATAHPGYLIAKGGITSHDLAAHGLGARRVDVLGQLLPGVPLWRMGPETRLPGLPYVVFPGNVGGPGALREAFEVLRGNGARL